MTKADSGLQTGTIGDGVANSVIQGIDDILKQSQVKNAALQYFSKKVTPNNFGALQGLLREKDVHGTGYLKNDDFVRCLSTSQMKVTESEVQTLVQELDKDGMGQVNYQDFLKYSYLCQMYI